MVGVDHKGILLGEDRERLERVNGNKCFVMLYWTRSISMKQGNASIHQVSSPDQSDPAKCVDRVRSLILCQ